MLHVTQTRTPVGDRSKTTEADVDGAIVIGADMSSPVGISLCGISSDAIIGADRLSDGPMVACEIAPG